MSRTSSTPDLKGFVDTLAPRVESAIHAVAEKAPPAFERGRAAAVEHGAHAAEVLGDRLPDSFVDRLPESVAEHLSASRPRRGRKLLLVGGLAALAGAAVVAWRRSSQAVAPSAMYTPAPVGEHRSASRPAAVPPEPTTPVNGSDPLGVRPTP